MQPFVRLLHKLCQISGKGFEKKQMLASAKGMPCLYRIVELYYGNSLLLFWQEMSAVLHSRVVAIPTRDSSSKGIRSLMFRMVARGLAYVHQRLRCHGSGFPQTLFRVLSDRAHAEVVVKKPVCMRDTMSAKILGMYPDAESLLSTEALTILTSLAHNYSVDTYEVERSFSEVRRRVKGKTPQTWAPNLSDVAAECFIRFARKRNQMAQQFFPPETAQQKRKTGVRRRKRLRRRCGGAWQAFCREKFKGRRFTNEDVKKAKAEYHAMKQGPEFQSLKERGILARMKVARGLSSHSEALFDQFADLSAAVHPQSALVQSPPTDSQIRRDLQQLRQQHREAKLAADNQEQETALAISQVSSDIQQKDQFAQWSAIHQSVSGVDLPVPETLSTSAMDVPLVISEFLPPTTSMAIAAWKHHDASGGGDWT